MKKNAVHTAHTSKNKLVRRTSGLMALEQRFMFDGAAVADAVDKAIDLQVFAPAAIASSESLAQAEARAEQLLTDFLKRPDVREQLFALFKGEQTGEQASNDWQTAVDQLLARAEQGQLNVRVELRSAGELQGAKGAFSATGTAGEATIYLNADWLATADSESVAIVLTEEFGHYLDRAINGDADTSGDEGEVFAQFLVNGTQPLPVLFDLTDNDHTILSLDGQQVLAELASFNFVNAYEMVYDQDDDTVSKTTAQITTADIDVTERWADKEQNSHFFNASVSLGNVRISDGSGNQNFSGNDVSAIAAVVGGNTYYGWISRPIKSNGVVRGFYFWTDTRFTTLAAAQADGNQDGDSTVINNRGFLFVVDQGWFDTQIAAGTTGVTINNTKDGNDGTITVANVGSSSDRVDSALNSILTPNSAPLAANDSLTVGEDSGMITRSGTNSLLNNDSDPNNDALTITSFSVGGVNTPLSSGTGTYIISGAGTITIRSDGSYDFTPAAGFSGAVPPITYTVSDGNGSSVTAVLSISVTPANDAPTGSNDSVTTPEDTAVILGLNDFGTFSDPDGQELQKVQITTLENNGSLEFFNGTSWVAVTLNQEVTAADITAGKLRFVPDASETGSPYTTVGFKVSDGIAYASSAYTLTVHVTPVGDLPSAQDDNTNGAVYAVEIGYGAAGSSQIGNVLTNDSDPDLTGFTNGTELRVSRIASTFGNSTGSSVTAGSTSTSGFTSIAGLYGTLKIGADGSYVYEVDNSHPTVQAQLPSSADLTEYFTYTLLDASGLTATATLKAVIKGSNDTPVALDDYDTVQEAAGVGSSPVVYGTATGNVSVNDDDVDGPTVLVSQVVANPTITYSLAFGGSANSLRAVDVDEVYVKVSTAADSTYVKLTKSDGTNVLVNSLSGSGNAVSATFSDTSSLESFIAQNGTNITVKLVEISGSTTDYLGVMTTPGTSSGTTNSIASGSSTTIAGTYGSLLLNSDGTYTYRLTSNSLTAGQTYTEKFEYTLTDGTSSDKAVLHILLNGSSAVVMVDDTDSTAEDIALTISNGDPEDLLSDDTGVTTIASFSWGGIAKNAGETITIAGVGQLTINSDGSYTFVPAANYTGEVPVAVYNATSGSTDTGSATLSLSITPANDSPSGTDDAVTTPEDTTRLLTVDDFGRFSDPEGSSLSKIKITTLETDGALQYFDGSTWQDVTLNQEITASDINNSKLRFVPDGNENGSPYTTVGFQVSDGTNYSSSTYTLTVNVTPVNDPPVNTVPGVQTLNSSPTSAFSNTLAFSAANSNLISVDDVENNIDQVVLSVTHGTLSSSTTVAGVTVSGSNTSTLTITPTTGSTINKADVNSILAALTYTVANGFDGSDQLVMTTTDATDLQDRDVISITVNADDRPVTVLGTVVNESSPYVMFEVSGAEGQWISLALASTYSGSGLDIGHATMGTDFLPNLQYFNGSAWVDYTGGLVQIPDTVSNNDKMLVRTAVLQDSVWESTAATYETFKLTAYNAAGTPNAITGSVDTLAEGMSQIRDDGQGSVFLGNNNGGGNNTLTANGSTDTDPSGPDYPGYLDDDRPVTVDNIVVNEASPWAMFTVSGYAGQVLSLSLHEGTAKVGDGSPADGTEDYSPSLQYWNGAAWVAYNGPSVTLISSTLLVRTAIHHDTLFEGQHAYALGVTKLSSNITVYGTAAIYDDGTGNVYAFDNDNDGTATITTGPGVGFDDDRTLTINSPLVNEASNFVVFTLTGNSGQTVSLQLQDESSSGTVAGKANILENQILKIWDGLAWVDYNASNLPTFNADGKIFVRVDIIAEQDAPYEGGETFKLNATLTGQSTVVTGVATITDDGTGVKYPGTFTSGSPTTDSTSLDNDQNQAITVNSVTVNEGSPYVVFTVTGSALQPVSLALSGQNTDGANLNTIQYFDGATWLPYTSGAVALDGSGALLVRVALSPEQEAALDGPEQFNLVVTDNSGTPANGVGTIVDDGSGSYFAGTNNTGTSSVPLGVVLDDDRPITVTGGSYNENSPRAVFIVNANPGQLLTLDVQNAAESGKAPTGDNEGKLNDSLDTAPIYYSLDGGATWQLYTGPINAGNVPVLVAVDITNERDDVYEGEEQLKLVVTSGGQSASGHAAIFDDGTGTVTRNITDQTTNDTGGNDPRVAKDDDRPKLAPVPLPPEAPLPPAPAPEAIQPETAKPVQQMFSSEVQPLAPRLVPVEAPVPLGDILTSSSGFRVAVNETASPGLSLHRGITDQFVEGDGSSAKVSLPYDAFIHSNKDAVIKLDAKLADNSPLPGWVRFDPATGSFDVNPPKDFKGKLDLKVVALDDDGREAVALFQLFVGDKPAEQKPQSRNSLTEKLRLAGQRPLTLIKVGDVNRPGLAPEASQRVAAAARATAG